MTLKIGMFISKFSATDSLPAIHCQTSPVPADFGRRSCQSRRHGSLPGSPHRSRRKTTHASWAKVTSDTLVVANIDLVWGVGRLREKIVNVERNLGKAWLLQVAINGYEPLKPSTITNLVGCASTLGTLVLLSLAMKMYLLLRDNTGNVMGYSPVIQSWILTNGTLTKNMGY